MGEVQRITVWLEVGPYRAPTPMARATDHDAAIATLRRELEAEKARFEEHHAAWLENHQYLAGRVRELEALLAKLNGCDDNIVKAMGAVVRRTGAYYIEDLDTGSFQSMMRAAIDAARAADAVKRT